MNKNIYKYLVLSVVVVLAVALRIYLLVRPGHGSDIGLFTYWADQIRSGGLWNLYNANFYQNNVDYPPLVPLLTAWWFNLGDFLGVQNMTTFFKLIPTFAEIIFAALISYLILDMKGKYKYILLVVVVLQPALVLVSEGWGQVDSLMTLLVLSGFMLLEKIPSLSTVFMFLAVLVKPQAAIAVGFYFLFFLVKKKYKEFTYQLIIFVLLFALLWIAFYLGSGGGNILTIFTHAVGRYTNSSLNAFNLWWALYGQNSWNIADSSGIPSIKNIGLILFILFEIPALIFFFRKCRDLAGLLLVVSYSYFMFFVFPTEIHERYMFAAVALMAVPALRYPRLFWVYILITITFLVNVFAILQTGYHPYEFWTTISTGDLWTKVVSFLNLAIAFYLAYFIYDESFKETK